MAIVSLIRFFIWLGWITVLYAAVEACLACCAECFVGIIENLVEYFNRCEPPSVLAFALIVNGAGMRISKLRFTASPIFKLQKTPGGCSRTEVSQQVSKCELPSDPSPWHDRHRCARQRFAGWDEYVFG